MFTRDNTIIISTNCYGGWVGRKLNIKQNHLTWYLMLPNVLNYIVDNYDNIDFSNVIFFNNPTEFLTYARKNTSKFTIEESTRLYNIYNKFKNVVYCIIDNKLPIQTPNYPHKILLKKHNYNNNQLEYIKNMYIRRLNRCKHNNIIFLLETYNETTLLQNNIKYKNYKYKVINLNFFNDKIYENTINLYNVPKRDDYAHSKISHNIGVTYLNKKFEEQLV